MLHLGSNKNIINHSGGNLLKQAKSELTLDSEPGVTSGVASRVLCRALEHPAVLPPHVVDQQRPVLEDVVSHRSNVLQGLGVPVPGYTGGRRPTNVTRNLQLLGNLAQCLEWKL